jgi:cytochrome P450
MVGKDSIVALNGQAWKSVHSMVVPGFRPSAVRGLLGTVAGEILVMRDLMARMAETGEVFEMEKLVGNAVFGMIAMSLMGERVGSQEEGGSSVMRDVHEPIHYTTLADRTSNPIKKKWFVRKAFRAQEKSGAWIERTTLDHYQRIKSEDTGVSECLMDAILINRIRTEQAGEVKMTLDQDKHWMDSWKTQ